MTDRIKEPWGERTPFGPGEEWPVRVDQFLEQGLSEDDIDRWVQTASILHSNGDALDVAVRDSRIVGVRGRGVDRVNKGRVDPKDLFGWQANNAGDRLRKPLVRENGELVEASWDEALARIVERSKELLEEKGPLAFGFYTTGQLFLEEYYTLGVIGKAGLGTPHMDGNTRLCTATAAEALKQTFGTDGQPGSYTDVDRADAICLYGHNVSETQAVLWMRMLDRLEGPRPPKARRSRSQAHAGRAEGRRAPSGQERDQHGPHERAPTGDRRQRLVRGGVRRCPRPGLRSFEADRDGVPSGEGGGDLRGGLRADPGGGAHHR